MSQNIFNSLGSNYDFKFAFRNLFPNGNSSDYEALRSYLSEHFGGKAFLFYKGREALAQALIAADLPKGSLVAINGFTCYAVEEAAKRANVESYYLDIDKNQLNFSAKSFEKAVKNNPKIKAVIIQNTLGYSCDIDAIESIAKKNKIVLIEDLAHSLGLQYKDGRKAGTVGDFTMLSFGRDKVVDAVAGGALIVRKNINQKWQKNLKQKRTKPSLRQRFVDRTYPLSTWSIRKTYGIGIGKGKQVFLSKLGLLPKATDGDYNGFTDLPNSYCKEILRQLVELDENKHRNKIADIYRKVIPKSMIPKIAHSSNGAVELRFPVVVESRNNLLKHLKHQGINIADIWYDSPIAPPRFMEKTSYSNGQCAESELLCDSLLNLPTHRNISEEQAKWLAERII